MLPATAVISELREQAVFESSGAIASEAYLRR